MEKVHNIWNEKKEHRLFTCHTVNGSTGGIWIAFSFPINEHHSTGNRHSILANYPLYSKKKIKASESTLEWYKVTCLQTPLSQYLGSLLIQVYPSISSGYTTPLNTAHNAAALKSPVEDEVLLIPCSSKFFNQLIGLKNELMQYNI